MAEPKKETVRIVLPARNDGIPVTSSPRESAMINLPQKPVPVSNSPGSLAPRAPVPPVISAPLPAPIPGIPKPPSAPGMPKPPSAPGIPRPPGMISPPPPAVPPMSPKPLPPAGSGAPASVSLPGPAPVIPAPLPPVGKKETAKVGLGAPTKILPQATVQFKRPAPSTAQSVSTSAPLTVAKDSEGPAVQEVSPILGGAALALAIVALIFQIWMMTGYKAP